MEKLTIKELAPYLPYGLKVQGEKYKEVYTLLDCNENTLGLRGNYYRTDYDEIKPILRPLSDLTKEIEVNGEKFVAYEILSFSTKAFISSKRMTLSPYYDIQKLLSWHFDVFGLIEKGLAIDINTLE